MKASSKRKRRTSQVAQPNSSRSLSIKMALERARPSPRAYTSRMALEAKTPETLVASIDMDREGSGKMHIDIKGRWLGTSGAGIAD